MELLSTLEAVLLVSWNSNSLTDASKEERWLSMSWIVMTLQLFLFLINVSASVFLRLFFCEDSVEDVDSFPYLDESLRDGGEVDVPSEFDAFVGFLVAVHVVEFFEHFFDEVAVAGCCFGMVFEVFDPVFFCVLIFDCVERI